MRDQNDMMGGSVSEIPYYDEDLDEAYVGPEKYNEMDDESYDDGYWEESQRLIEATMEGANISANNDQIVSDNTQHLRLFTSTMPCS